MLASKVLRPARCSQQPSRLQRSLAEHKRSHSGPPRSELAASIRVTALPFRLWSEQGVICQGPRGSGPGSHAQSACWDSSLSTSTAKLALRTTTEASLIPSSIITQVAISPVTP